MRQKYHFANKNGIIIWDVTSILEDIHSHPENYNIQYLPTKLLADHNESRISHTQAMAADLSVPLVVAELTKGRPLLIDGNHRLYKACVLGMREIPCYYLSREQQQRFILHFRPAEYEKIVGFSTF